MMRHPSISKRSFLGAAFGTMVEYYDATALGLLLPLIAPLFFPSNNDYDALVKGYYVLMISMFARPLGGLFFGYVGDMFGRRKALLCSMYGIAIATLCMGIIPTYATIGAWSCFMIVAIKCVQTFCFGGEYNGAGIYVVEHALNKRESLTGSFLTAMMLAGSIAATLIGYIISLDGMPVWSWRVAFILGGFIGIVAVLFRNNLPESPHFIQANTKTHTLINLLKNYPREMIAGMFMGGFATLPFTTILMFVNPVLMTQEIITKPGLMLLQTYLILVAISSLLIAGYFADKLTPARVMKFGALSLVLLAYPLVLVFDFKILALIVFAQTLLIMINELLLGPSNACLKNLFPMQYRYRGASLSFTIGLAAIGGLTPVIESALYNMTGKFSSISIWLIAIGIGTYLSLKWAIHSPISSRYEIIDEC